MYVNNAAQMRTYVEGIIARMHTVLKLYND